MKLTILILSTVFLVLSACDDAEPAQTPSVHSDRQTTATEATATEEQTASGVRGTVTAYSDVASLPDEPLADQAVVILPLEAAGAVLGSASPPDPNRLRFLTTEISEPDSRITLVVSDGAGRYEAALAPGDYVLCLADAAGTSPGDYPLAVRGCGLFTVPVGAVAEVNVSSGFREIELETN